MSRISILQYIEKIELVPTIVSYLLTALKASPLKFLPHSSDEDVSLTMIYIVYTGLLGGKNDKKAANGD